MLLRGSGLLFGCLKVSKNKQPDDKDDEKYKMNVLSFSYSWNPVPIGDGFVC